MAWRLYQGREGRVRYQQIFPFKKRDESRQALTESSFHKETGEFAHIPCF